MAKIQIRRDSMSTWSAVNPILAEGELGLELGSGFIKIGDGIRTWNQLPYLSTGSGGGGGTSDPNSLKRGDNVSELFNDANYISVGDELDDIVINGTTFNGDVAFNSSIEQSGVLFGFDDASLRFKDDHTLVFGTDEIDGMIYSGTHRDETGVHFMGSGSDSTFYRWGSTEFRSAINGNPLVKIEEEGGVELYYQFAGSTGDNLKRLETTSEGAKVTGIFSVSNDNTDSGKFEVVGNGAYSQLNFYRSDGIGGASIQGVEGNLYINAGSITLGFGNNFRSDGEVDFNKTTPLTTTVNFHNGFNIVGGDVDFGDADITTTGDITAHDALFELGTVTVTGYNSLSQGSSPRAVIQDNEISLKSYVYSTGGSVGTKRSSIKFTNTSQGNHIISSGYTGAGEITFGLPNSQGNSNQVLASDGNGGTRWINVSTDGGSNGGGGTGGAVDSVNDQTGVVSLGIQDMNDYALYSVSTDYDGNTTRVTSTDSVTGPFPVNAGEWTIGIHEAEGVDDWFEYNPNQSGYMDLLVQGSAVTFKADGVSDHVATVTQSPQANGSQPTIYFRISPSWPQEWLDIPDGSAVTVSSDVFDGLGLKQPLIEGDILKWDDTDKKFKPNQIPAPSVPTLQEVTDQGNGTSNDISVAQLSLTRGIQAGGSSDNLNWGSGNFYFSGGNPELGWRNGGTIRVGTGSTVAGLDIKLGNPGDNSARFIQSGGVELYYDNVKKFETTSTGVTISDVLNLSPVASLPSAGTSGDLVNVSGVLYYHDGIAFREVYLYDRPPLPTDPDTDWDKVVLRVPFDTDLNDVKSDITGAPSSSSIEDTFTEAPNKFGGGACRLETNTIRYTDDSLDIFNGEWTVEFWINLDTWNSGNYTNIFEVGDVALQRYKSGTTSSYTIAYYNPDMSSSVRTLFSTSGTSEFAGWKHFALTRDGLGTIKFYLDGILKNPPLIDVDIPSGEKTIKFGHSASLNTLFIDDIRVSNFVRYSENFSPPTVAYPIFGLEGEPEGPDENFSDYVFRTPYDTDLIDIITPTGVRETGTPEISSFLSKYGTGSLRLRNYSGTEFIQYTDSNVILPGSFTIEFWMNIFSTTTNTTLRTVMDNSMSSESNDNDVQTGIFEISVVPYDSNGGRNIFFKFFERIGSSWNTHTYQIGQFTVGQWEHIAVVREGIYIRTYLNGVKSNEVMTDLYFNDDGNVNRIISIGRASSLFGNNDASSPSRAGFDGYLDDIRIMNRAEYTGDSFTPPIAPHPVE